MNMECELCLPQAGRSRAGGMQGDKGAATLNLSGQTAHIDLTLYFEDREPLRP